MSQDDKKHGPRDKYLLIFDDGVEQLSDVSVSPNTEWYSQSDFKKKKLVSCIRLIEHSAYLELEKERDRWKDAADDYKSASRIAIEAGNQLIAERDKWRKWALRFSDEVTREVYCLKLAIQFLLDKKEEPAMPRDVNEWASIKAFEKILAEFAEERLK